MKKIVLVNGISQGNMLAGMGCGFGKHFSDAGYEFVELNLASTETALNVMKEKIIGQDVELAFSFMGLGCDLVVQDQNGKSFGIWEESNIPFVSLYGDSPAHFFDRHVVRNSNFATLYGFPEHAALRRRLPLINGVIGTCGAVALDPISRDAMDIDRKVNGQLLFLKNTHNPDVLWESWEKALPPRLLKAIREIASHLEANLCNPESNQIDDIVIDYFSNYDFDVKILTKLRLFFISNLDHYLRYVKAATIARILADFPVQIRGTGWEHVDLSNKRCTYINSCDYKESGSLIQNSLGMIDISPNTGLSPHDRVLRSWGSYTLCLTNEQHFFNAAPHKDRFMFSFEPESVRSRIADAIANPARTVEEGIEVATYFRSQYTPEVFVSRMLEIAAAIRLDRVRNPIPGMPVGFVWPPASLL